MIAYLSEARTFLLIAWILLQPNCIRANSGGPSLRGALEKCHNEGEKVNVPIIAGDPCIKCTCTGGHVTCMREPCSVTNCHLLSHRKEGCCDVCKSCTFNGLDWASGREWSDSQDSCKAYLCQAGVVTIAKTQCFTPCRNPIAPVNNTCCSTCQGCNYKGSLYREGEEFRLDVDRCIKCKCKNGNIECRKEICPVLSCPSNKIFQRSEACCPECKGNKKVQDIKANHCYVGKKIHRSGQLFQVDECTDCECQGSTAVCERKSCPPLQCPIELQVVEPGTCCAQCVTMQARPHDTCMHAGKEYMAGETWRLGTCTICECRDGETRCMVQQCVPDMTCPPRHTARRKPGECCPKCEEDDAVCTVFGDPHYRTFDGRPFDFQGPCKYVLSQDCHSGSFNIRVRNDVRKSKYVSWTKTVFLQVGVTKVVLQQRLVVKVDKAVETLPFIKLGVLSIVQDGDNVVVRTNIGVKITWDGNSFLEVAVSPSFKNKLCGLCGNYNDDQSDDFKKRRGMITADPAAFGASWRVGSKRLCGRQDRPPNPSILCYERNRTTDHVLAFKECSYLKSPAFAACRQRVSHARYFNSCLQDMCECPRGKQCFCQAFKAYSRECMRAGVPVVFSNSTARPGVSTTNKCGLRMGLPLSSRNF